uniref:Uncharacterized protein n=1 Tax=Oryza sativa subsp. japonica TaxID=39947 RepID=Q8H3U3_ORYSJ|nr:hypothetical protein [Oryza sativa Japonica Group]
MEDGKSIVYRACKSYIRHVSTKYAAISHTAASIGVQEIILLAQRFSHQYAAISHTATSIGVREIILLAHWFSHQYVAISHTATSIGVREIIPLAHWFSHQYAAISHTAASIGVREIIPLAHWFSHQYAAISHTATSIGVREIILLAHWFSHQYVAISRYDYDSVAVLVPRLQVIEGHLLTSPQPVDRSDLSYICFKWSSYGYCLVLDQRCGVTPATSTFSGRVTATAWSSTSDVAFLRLLPLSVVKLWLLPGPRPAMWRSSDYFHFQWSSYGYCLVLDQRCSVSPTTSFTSDWSSYDYCLVLDQRCSDLSHYLYFNVVGLITRHDCERTSGYAMSWYVAISHTVASIGVREIILLAHWFSHQYAAISHTATSIGVGEIILLTHWFSHQYTAISHTSPQPVDRSDLSYICFKWSSYGYCLVLDQRCGVPPTTSTFSGRVTATAWSSTSDLALLRQIPLSVWSSYDYCLLPDQRCSDFSHYLYFNVVGLITRHDCERTSGYAISWWSSYGNCLVLDKRCGVPPTTSTFSGQAISHTAASIGVREIILLAHWFSHQYAAISRTSPQPVDRSDLSYICFKWSSYGYCLVLDQRCGIPPTTSTFSGRVTATAWSSTSDVAFLRLLLLSVVQLQLLPRPRSAMWRSSDYFYFQWSSYGYCLVLDQRCGIPPTTSTFSGRVTATA